jgi:hypothetical protein
MSSSYSSEIVGYMFRADLYTPLGVIAALPTGENEIYDGWGLSPLADDQSTESNLDEIAYAFGINRNDEYSFDSSEFPKVVFRYMLEGGEEFQDENGIYQSA